MTTINVMNLSPLKVCSVISLPLLYESPIPCYHRFAFCHYTFVFSRILYKQSFPFPIQRSYFATHVVAYMNSSYLFIDEQYFIVWVHYNLFIHSSVDGHLSRFKFLSIISMLLGTLMYKLSCMCFSLSLGAVSK